MKAGKGNGDKLKIAAKEKVQHLHVQTYSELLRAKNRKASWRCASIFLIIHAKFLIYNSSICRF